jgi:hypothetical protein
VIMAMIYAVGHVSGAHLNGAVTFAFALTRHFPGRASSPTGAHSSSAHSWRRRSSAPRSATSPTSARLCLRERRRSPSSGRRS